MWPPLIFYAQNSSYFQPPTSCPPHLHTSTPSNPLPSTHLASFDALSKSAAQSCANSRGRCRCLYTSESLTASAGSLSTSLRLLDRLLPDLLGQSTFDRLPAPARRWRHLRTHLSPQSACSTVNFQSSLHNLRSTGSALSVSRIACSGGIFII